MTRVAAIVTAVLVVTACRHRKPLPDPPELPPAPPPDARVAPKPAGPDVGALLHVDDAAAIAKLSRLFADAAKLLAHDPVDPDALYDYLHENFGKLSSEQVNRGAIATMEQQAAWGRGAELLLRLAADTLRESRGEGASPYEARHDVMIAFRAAYPSSSSSLLRLHPESGIAIPPGFAACPPDDGSLRVKHRFRYFEDPEYVRFFTQPDAQLSEGALRPVVSLLAVGVMMNEFDQGGGPRPTNLAPDLVVRYHQRALPCLADAMHDPDAWITAGGNAGTLRRQTLDVLQRLPASAAMPLYQAAAEAGWNDWLRALPAGGELGALKDAYVDSPYDPGIGNDWRPYSDASRP